VSLTEHFQMYFEENKAMARKEWLAHKGKYVHRSLKLMELVSFQ